MYKTLLCFASVGLSIVIGHGSNTQDISMWNHLLNDCDIRCSCDMDFIFNNFLLCSDSQDNLLDVEEHLETYFIDGILLTITWYGDARCNYHDVKVCVYFPVSSRVFAMNKNWLLNSFAIYLEGWEMHYQNVFTNVTDIVVKKSGDGYKLVILENASVYSSEKIEFDLVTTMKIWYK